MSPPVFGDKDKEKKPIDKAIRKNVRADVQCITGRVRRHLKDEEYDKCMVYLDAVHKYLAAELLEIFGEKVKNMNEEIISLRQNEHDKLEDNDDKLENLDDELKKKRKKFDDELKKLRANMHDYLEAKSAIKSQSSKTAQEIESTSHRG